MMPREIGNLRENRLTHRGNHKKKYNEYVGNVLDSMENTDITEPEFKSLLIF